MARIIVRKKQEYLYFASKYNQNHDEPEEKNTQPSEQIKHGYKTYESFKGEDTKSTEARKSTITKVVISCTIAIVLLFVIIGRGKKLSGDYISESGTYAVDFETDGTCTWYQDGTFCEGTYKAKDGMFILTIQGHGFYSNGVFEAVRDYGDLIIDGGTVHHERFRKK